MFSIFFNRNKSNSNTEEAPAQDEINTKPDQLIIDEATERVGFSPDDFSQREELVNLEKSIFRARRISEATNNISDLITGISNDYAAIENLSDLSKTTLLSKLKQERELQATIKSMRQLEDENHQANRKLEEISVELSSVKKSEQTVKEALTEAREIIFNIKTSSKRAADLFKDTLIENEEQKNELTKKESECIELEAKLEAALNQKNGFGFELDGLSKRAMELEAQIREKDLVAENLNESNRLLSHEISTSNTKYINLKEEFAKLEVSMSAATDEVDNLKKHAELTERKHHNTIFSMKTEVDNLKSRLRLAENSLKEASNQSSALKDKEIENSRLIETAETELENMRVQRDRYSHEIEEINAKLQEINIKYDSAISDCQQEQDNNRDLAAHIGKLNEQLKRAESLKIKYEHAIEENEQLKTLINDHIIASGPDAQEDAETLSMQENENTSKAEKSLHVIN